MRRVFLRTFSLTTIVTRPVAGRPAEVDPVTEKTSGRPSRTEAGAVRARVVRCAAAVRRMLTSEAARSASPAKATVTVTAPARACLMGTATSPAASVVTDRTGCDGPSTRRLLPARGPSGPVSRAVTVNGTSTTTVVGASTSMLVGAGVVGCCSGGCSGSSGSASCGTGSGDGLGSDA